MRSFLARALTGTVLTAGMLAVGAGAAVANDTHTVSSGDTLSSIAAENDGVDSWRDLAEANSDVVSNPNRIFIGQELTLTGGSSSSTTTTTQSEPASTPAHNGSVPLETWDRLAECESNQTWDINTGNTFYGGLQFNKMSWDWAVDVGGHDVPAYPHNATRMQQIEVAETLLDIHPAGWGAWPACTRALGIR